MEQKKTLVQLTNEYRAIEQKLLEGEAGAALENDLEQTTAALVSKVDACAFVLEHLDSDAEYYRAKAKELSNVARSYENMAKRLRDRVKYAMKEIQASELCGTESKFKLTTGGQKLVIEDETKLPADFFENTVVREINHDLVRMAIETGIVLEGARLEDITRLSIKPNKPKELINGSDTDTDGNANK